MPQPHLDGLDVETVGDQQAGEIVPQIVEPETGRQTCN
jgi:hypothetical protein